MVLNRMKKLDFPIHVLLVVILGLRMFNLWHEEVKWNSFSFAFSASAFMISIFCLRSALLRRKENK